MLYYKEFQKNDYVPEILGNKKKFDNTIYTFDIETTSYYIYGGEIYPSSEYLKLSKKEQEEVEYRSNMYIWMFGVNDIVYYGRTWEEFIDFFFFFFKRHKYLKYIYVHNLSFEFQFLKSVIHFKEVTARKSHKVMKAICRDFNIEFRCSYFLSNCKLEKLPELYHLNVKKLVGNLDYKKLRHSETILSEKELEYCENDCLVLYEYIKFELRSYLDIKHIPMTSTGKVRRELQELTRTNYAYKRRTSKAINENPIIFNRLQEAFFGGYTHANYIWTDEVIKNVDSFDETSAYPYVMVSEKYPSSEFRECKINSHKELSKHFCYILVVKFKNVVSKYYNNFISASKCREIRGAKYDNGRIIEAKEFIMTLTEVDFNFYLETYDFEYEILESYYSTKTYLPRIVIDFILDKYVLKTKLKNVEEAELEYQIEKGKFNSIYGMSVTNTIRDNVIYKDDIEEWFEEELTNDEIVEKLEKEKKKAFLSFSWGVYVTAYARRNLLKRVIDLDPYVVYCDTDSIKLAPGYDREVFTKYNNYVKKKIAFVSKELKIPIEKYEPEDIKGNKHLLGVFESETKGDSKYTYQEFITQGAKKYAVKQEDKIHITVAGVPKSGSSELDDLHKFKDDLVFHHETTNKNLLIYVENQYPVDMIDYQGNKLKVKDKSGCSLIPTTYVLGKSLDYCTLLDEASSNRARYKEG